MRKVKTALSILKDDTIVAFKFLFKREFLVILGVLAWLIGGVAGAEYALMLYPDNGDIPGLIFLGAYIGTTILIGYVVILVHRTKKRVAQENRNVMSTLRGNKNGPTADWID